MANLKGILGILKSLAPDLDAPTDMAKRRTLQQMAAAPISAALPKGALNTLAPLQPVPDRQAMLSALNQFLTTQGPMSPYVGHMLFSMDKDDLAAHYQELYDSSLDALYTDGVMRPKAIAKLSKRETIDAANDYFGSEVSPEHSASMFHMDPEFHDKLTALQQQHPELSDEALRDVYHSVMDQGSAWDEARRRLGHFDQWEPGQVPPSHYEKLMGLSADDYKKFHKEALDRSMLSNHFSPDEMKQLVEPLMDDYDPSAMSEFPDHVYQSAVNYPRANLIGALNDGDSNAQSIMDDWYQSDSPHAADIYNYAKSRLTPSKMKALAPYQPLDDLSTADLPQFGLRDYRQKYANRPMPYSQASKLGLLQGSDNADY